MRTNSAEQLEYQKNLDREMIIAWNTLKDIQEAASIQIVTDQMLVKYGINSSGYEQFLIEKAHEFNRSLREYANNINAVYDMSASIIEVRSRNLEQESKSEQRIGKEKKQVTSAKNNSKCVKLQPIIRQKSINQEIPSDSHEGRHGCALNINIASNNSATDNNINCGDNLRVPASDNSWFYDNNKYNVFAPRYDDEKENDPSCAASDIDLQLQAKLERLQIDSPQDTGDCSLYCLMDDSLKWYTDNVSLL
ncbi:MAG: hypothetical protein MHMPM18_000788 [Marteilia pararefringens]